MVKCCCFPAPFPVQKYSCQWLSQRLQGVRDPGASLTARPAFSRELAHGWRKTRLASPLFRSVILAFRLDHMAGDLYSPEKPSPEFKVRAERRAKVIGSRAEIFNRKSLLGPTGRMRGEGEVGLCTLKVVCKSNSFFFLGIITTYFWRKEILQYFWWGHTCTSKSLLT